MKRTHFDPTVEAVSPRNEEDGSWAQRLKVSMVRPSPSPNGKPVKDKKGATAYAGKAEVLHTLDSASLGQN